MTYFADLPKKKMSFKLTKEQKEALEKVNKPSSNCYNCYYCSNCSNCSNCSDKKYMIKNVQFTEKQYETFKKGELI